MTYVPIPATVPIPPSPRARELADRLHAVIQEYREERHQVTDQEVRVALQLTQQRSVTPFGGARAAVLAGAGLLALAVGLFGYLFVQDGGTSGGAAPGILALAVIIAVLGVLVAFIKFMRSDGP